MGVPNFFTWLTKRYPMCLYEFDQPAIDYFFLDMNQVIYKCATTNTLFKDQVLQRHQDDIWVSICNYLDNIISSVHPDKLLFLTFDGVAPRAKMNQQRQRRFQSAKRTFNLDQQLNSLNVLDRNDSYKSNQFTAGTDFMNKLNEQIKFFIAKKNYQAKVIFSGSDVPGEGEHKILDYIRCMKEQNGTYMIYGADADLIMLGLSTQLKHICILREYMKFSHEVPAAAQRTIYQPTFQIINLSMVREYMDLEYCTLQMKIEYDINRIIDDFILLCFFIGNDFLPRVFCFDIRQGTLEALIILFKKHLSECDNYLTNRGDINWEQFTKLMERLAEFEILALEQRVVEMDQYLKEPNKEQELLKSIQKDYQKKQDINARTQFYESKLNINLMTDEKAFDTIYDINKNYLKGIQFVLYYYYKGVPSWSWFYKYYYAPLCFDLCLFIQEFQENPKIDFNMSSPWPPAKQLLAILSPINSELLPKEYQHLLKSNSILRQPYDYYPDEFEIDPYGAIWEHQYIAKIPFIDENLLEKAYSSVPANKQYNPGVTILFKETEKNQKYKSTLSNIFEDYEINLEQVTIELNQNVVESLPSKTKSPLPSLRIKQFQSFNLKDLGDTERKSQILQLHLKESEIPFDLEIAYCGYPKPVKCQICAFVTPKEIIYPTKKNVQLKLLDGYRIEKHFDYHRDFEFEIKSKYSQKGLIGEIKNMAIVREFKQPYKMVNGELYYQKGQEQVIPLEWVFEECPLEQKQEFSKNNFLAGELISGNVGLIQENNKNSVIMHVIRQPQNLKVFKEDHINFYSLNYVANDMDISSDTVLFIMGSIQVQLEHQLAKVLDIGLNIINRTNNQLVPDLVRLPYADQHIHGRNKYQQFNHLEISANCLKILKEYQKKCPNLFRINKQKYKWDDLYDNVNQLLQFYLWILQLPESGYILWNSASSVIPASQLTNLPVMHPIVNNDLKQLDINYIQYPVSPYIPPYFKEHPPFHQLGDRVVQLNSSNFGAYGTVSGIVESKDDVLIEVVWDEPNFGLTNLGGRCPLLRGSLHPFNEVYNLTREWHKSLSPYQEQPKKGWDYDTKIYVPKFGSNCIDIKREDLKKKNILQKNVLQKQKHDLQQNIEQLMKADEFITNEKIEGKSSEELEMEYQYVEKEKEKEKEQKKIKVLQKDKKK